jgi:hypothetical protein
VRAGGVWGAAIWRWDGERRQVAQLLHEDPFGVVRDRIALQAVPHAQVVSFGEEPEGFGLPTEGALGVDVQHNRRRGDGVVSVNDADHGNAALRRAVPLSRLIVTAAIRSLTWPVGASNAVAEWTAGRSSEQLLACCDNGLLPARRDVHRARLVGGAGVG